VTWLAYLKEGDGCLEGLAVGLSPGGGRFGIRVVAAFMERYEARHRLTIHFSDGGLYGEV
jgi:hypothetical protein